jgi:hypothetical protein
MNVIPDGVAAYTTLPGDNVLREKLGFYRCYVENSQVDFEYSGFIEFRFCDRNPIPYLLTLGIVIISVHIGIRFDF